MKKLLHYKISFLVILAFSSVAHAQFQNGLWTGKQAYFWYMGKPKGFNFASTPPQVLTDGQSYAIKSGGTISDKDGNLLFYTDGGQIWNRNHKLMPNGTGLRTGVFPTGSGLTIPAPGRPDIYYVITVSNSNTNGGIFYTEVDMKLDNTLGGVTANKNIRLHTPGVAHKLTAVYNADEKQVWLVGHRANHLDPTHNDEFVAYLVTENGINTTPVVSKTGEPFHQYKDGQMKFSPDGSKIALVHSQGNAGPNVFEVFNFNAATGTISQPILTIDDRFSSFTSVWGLEFSPNSKLIYVTEIEASSRLYQYDLTAGDADAVRNSEVILGEVQFLETFYGLQAGPDGKIYMAHNNRTYHSVINYPNNKGIAAGFEYQALGPVQADSNESFPTFIQSYFQSGILYDGLCNSEPTNFSLLRIPGVTAVQWNFGDTASNTSTDIAPTHTFTGPGTYTVTATITSNGATQTATTQITIQNLPTAVQPANISMCDTGNGTAIFDFTPQQAIILGSQLATDFTVTYYTSQSDANADTNKLTGNLTAYSSTATTIYVRVQNNITGCYTTTSFNLVVTALPTVTQILPFNNCDNATADGFTTFDLTTQQAVLLNGQTGITLNYYTNKAEAEAGTNPIATPANFNNTSNPQTIYVALTNTTNCTSYTEFTLNVLALPTTTQIPTLFTCDTGAADGLTTFDLTSQDVALINGQTGITVTYFTTQADADADTNAITTPVNFDNTISPQTIYVRLSNASCFNTTTFTIEALEAPVLADNLTLTGCSPFNLTDIISQLGSGSDISFYTSETDANEATDAITEPENYILTASNNSVYIRAENSNGCFSVVPLALVTNGCEIQRGISPGDGDKNNTFDLTNFNVTKISIFNRYGKEVYSKNNYRNEWGGQGSNGDELPSGTYFYTFNSATTGHKTGWIYINRQN